MKRFSANAARFWRLFFVFVALIFVSACGADSESGSEDYVKSVSITPASAEIDATGTTTLTAQATLVGSPSVTYTWSVTNGKDYARVSSNGETATVTGTNEENSPQSVTVQVIASDGTHEVKKTATITVKAADKGVFSVRLSRITLNLLAGSTATLSATVETASDDIKKTVTWETSDKEVATVADDGTVTAVATGTAIITATSTADAGKTATCTVEVTGANETIDIWRADKYDKQTCSDNQKLGIMTVAVGGGTISIDENKKEIDDYSFTKRLKFGGSGSTSKNSIHFTTESAATITVYYISANSTSESRTLVLADSSGTHIASGTNDGKEIASFSTLSAVNAGTYYIYSSNSGINVYAVKIEYAEAQTLVYPASITLNKATISLERTDDTPNPTATLTATITNANEVTSGYGAINWNSSNPSVATVSQDGVVRGVKAGTATITACAEYGSAEATCEVTITGEVSERYIQASDVPTGFATITPQTGTGTTVTTKAELVLALSKGGLIYVSGTIDVSDGCLPSEAGGTTDNLDAFVKATTNSSYTTYTEFKTAYAASCSKSTDDKSSSSPESSLGSVLWKLNKAYGEKIKLSIKSDTTIIGLDGAVIKGGTFQISGASNVVIRNLTIQDGYDPFPHHEKDDGFNAQWDCIALNNASNKNIWIDHCTLEDTMKYSKVKISDNTEEKWQTYDGLLDITKGSQNVVVSYCVFKNHDKTMLIGNSETDTGGYITIHHNRFLNCGQRLPLTALPYMHIFNNSYERDSNAYYNQQACIAVRGDNFTVIAENNYFGTGVSRCITGSGAGTIYHSGNKFVSGSASLTSASAKPFSPSYSYTLDVAADVPAIVLDNAGAGKWVVRQ